MTINNAIKLIAGSFTLISLALGYLSNELWYLFIIFVGVNLIQSSFTGWCLMEIILKKVGLKHDNKNCSC